MLTLVLGGAASGKSGYAESLVMKTALPRYYIATMQVWDAECAARVEKHRKMRAAKQFETVECPLHLENIHLPARGTALLEARIFTWQIRSDIYNITGRRHLIKIADIFFQICPHFLPIDGTFSFKPDIINHHNTIPINILNNRNIPLL